MFSINNARQLVAMTCFSGAAFITSWIQYIASASIASTWCLVLSLLALIIVSFGIIRHVRPADNVSKGSQRKAFTLATIAVGHLGVAWLILADLYPRLDLLGASIGIAFWMTFIAGYGLLGLNLLRSQGGERWAGIPFVLTVVSAIVSLLYPSWTVLLAAATLGTICVGLGYLSFGVALFLQTRKSNVTDGAQRGFAEGQRGFDPLSA